MVIASFLFFLVLFVGIGAYAATRAEATTSDYLVANRSVNPWMTGLSTVATQNSGFMFIGMIGLTYAKGVSSLWLLAGSVCGTYVGWLFAFRRLREASGESDARTIPGFLAGSQPGARVVAIAAGVLTIVFLGTYAAAQLTAGSKALHVLFGWETWLGAAIGAGIIVLYCFAGGIRASIWTDTIQAVVMLVAMVLLLVVAVAEAGGIGGMWDELNRIDPNLTNVLPSVKYGFALYLIGWFVAGFGMVGQPHVMVRAMAMRSGDDAPLAGRVYIGWFAVFSIAAVGVGLACRVLLPDTPAFDAELALPRLSLQLLPSVLVGLVLAGLFAATMSTADSQVLSCSASLTQDLAPRWRDSYLMVKLATVAVTSISLAIALWAIFSGNDSVFTLVIMAWGALAAGLGPLMIVRLLAAPVSPAVALAMMSTGVAVVIVWRYQLELSGSVLEVFPGMAAGGAVYGIARLLRS